MSNTIKLFISYFIILNFCRLTKTGEGIDVIYREFWLATPTDETVRFKTKLLPYVIVHESGGPTCSDLTQCSKCLRDLQKKDLPIKKDIRYNFLIGGDGQVYEGRGWYRSGMNIPEYDFESISIAFIGTFSGSVYVTEQAWNIFQDFLNIGVAYGYLSKQYQLLGHRQFQIISKPHDIYQAECPGLNIYELLSFLSHWKNLTIEIYR